MQQSLQNVLEYSKQLTLLYVEDEDNIREETKGILENIFSSIITAIDGDDGLEKLQQNTYIDLILTDINMPKLNGIDMIKKIRSQNIQIPILVLSAHSDVNYFIDTIKLGIDGYILKPIEIKQLFYSIEKVTHKISLQKENEEYKHNLEIKVEQEIKKREYQEKILMHQSKLAAMGEMMDAVAHQWKQPLNIINMRIDMLQYDFEDDMIDDKYIDEFIGKFKFQMRHIVNTLDEFRNFFRPNKLSKEFKISNSIDSTLLLVNDEFLKNKIRFIKNIQDEGVIYGSENDFKHLILNIINNSKDAFNENEIQDRTININLFKKDETITLEIYDNAGGIPNKVIDNIFNANVTTKEEGKGTGIGLYMSKQIASKHSGKLYVENIDNGAKFIFETSIKEVSDEE
ncbi:MAG: hybrid sensor histidine kinase/response regulator [Campylobacterota bacterium]|nr:hybrid sensor histidine kinase/response regulator [Campylobacterota bacterium]